MTFLQSNEAANLPAFDESVISSLVFLNVSLTRDNVDEVFRSFSLKSPKRLKPTTVLVFADMASSFTSSTYFLVPERQWQFTD